MGELAGIFITGIVMLAIYKLFELFVKRKERLAIIDRLPIILNNNESNIPITLPDIYYGKRNYTFSTLKIALLFIGIGIGCMTAFFVQYGMFDSFKNFDLSDWGARNYVHQVQFVIYFSFISIFGGIGLLTSYLIEQKQAKKEE